MVGFVSEKELITHYFASKSANYHGLYVVFNNLSWHSLHFLTSFLKQKSKGAFAFLSSKEQLIDTSLRATVDIFSTRAQSRDILTTVEIAVGHLEEVAVDKRQRVTVESFQLFTTEMAMGLIAAGYLWCPQ